MACIQRNTERIRAHIAEVRNLHKSGMAPQAIHEHFLKRGIAINARDITNWVKTWKKQ